MTGTSRMAGRTAGICLSIGLLIGPAKGGAQVSVTSEVDRNQITIGDVVTYTVTIQHSPDMKVEDPGPAPNLGAFEIREWSETEPEKVDDRIVRKYQYHISTFDTGRFTIPPFPIRYYSPGDSVGTVLLAESVSIFVESLRPSPDGDIKDIVLPLEIPFSYRRIVLYSLLALVLLALAGGGYYYWRRRRMGQGLLPKRVSPPRPPHDVAYEELDKLASSDLLAKGEIKAWYTRVSDIVRAYIEGRFGIDALEMTSYEIMAELGSQELDGELMTDTDDFFSRCDLVKFAKFVPDQPEHDAALRQARRFVDDTRPMPVPDESDRETSAADETDEQTPETRVVEKEVT